MTNKKYEKQARMRAAQRRNRNILTSVVIVAAVGLLLVIFWPNISSLLAPSGAPTTDLIDPNAEIITTDTGLQYQEISVGSGAEAELGDQVQVHYTGWLSDGAQFDSSLTRGTPLEFILGNGDVIQGWEQGVTGMRVGGTRILIIPSELAYGEAGFGDIIPPGAQLIFRVELVDIVN